MKVWIDGEVRDACDARVPVTDHGLLYGDGVFEGLRVYAGRVFRLDDHLRRLQASADAIGLDLPEVGELRGIVLSTARAFARDDAYVRLIVTRGEGPLSVDPTRCERPRVICIAGEVALYPPEKLAAGIALATVSVRRPPPDVLDPRVKSLNYLNNAVAILEARRACADEALILNARGLIAEASGANVFTVLRGGLATPPPSDGALAGITRRTLIELAAELGMAFEERSLGRVDLFEADEVFLCGTGARVVPVAELDGRALAGGPRAVTEALITAYDARVRSEGTAIAAASDADP